jgi:thioredoxin 1
MSSANVVTITEANFETEVLGSSVPVLVDFWATWCGPCRMLSPIVDEIADAKVGSAKVGKVNVDENQSLAGRFGITGIPALLFFKDGQVQEQIQGNGGGKAALIAKLDALAGVAK